MRPATERRILLPPRPRLSDWFAAGAAAGALLGVAEFAVGWLTAAPLPPLLGLAVAGADVLLVGLACGGAGLVARARRWRVSHSGLVGAALGSLLFAPGVAALCTWNGAPGPVALLGSLASFGAALAAGAIGARLGDRLERSGMPLSALFVWVPGALGLASAERLFAPGIETGTTLLLAGVLLALGLAACGLFLLARRREPSVRASFVRLLVGVLVAGILAIHAPQLVPWFFYDRSTELAGGGPPNVLVLLAAPEALATAASFNRFAGGGGVLYERLLRSGGREAPGLLSLPDGASLESRLHALGFATATIASDPNLAPQVGLGEVDARPGDPFLLARRAAWTTGVPVLLGPAAGLLSLLGRDAALRSPERLAEDARHWLLHWRALRAPAPFFLVVDLRVAFPSEAPPSESVDAALERLITGLSQLEIDGDTWVVVAADAGDRRPDAVPESVLVRRPGTWSSARPARRIREPVSPTALALTLLRSAGGDAEAPLPGGA